MPHRCHRDRNFRFFSRCVTDEERVVAQFFDHRFLVVFFVLGNFEYLRGAGFAGHLVLDPMADAIRGSAQSMHDVNHGLMHVFPVLVLAYRVTTRHTARNID